MSILKRLKSWFTGKSTNPPPYENIVEAKKGVNSASILGTRIISFDLDNEYIFIHGFINKQGEDELNTTLQNHAKLGKDNYTIDLSVQRNRFFASVSLTNPENPFKIKYDTFKFFTDKLSNGEGVLLAAKAYLASAPNPDKLHRFYAPAIIDEDGEDPTFLVATQKGEHYTPAPTRP